MSQEGQEGKASLAPYALALVVCDAIWRDPWTGKRTILGCFSAIYAPTFPVVHPVMSVYLAITDGHGTVPIALRLIDADEERPAVFEVKGDVSFPDPRVVMELDFTVANILFPAAGEYRLQLSSGPNPLMERRIVVFATGEDKNVPDSETKHD